MNKYYGDYHTHTRYSDSVSKLAEVLETAHSKGLREVAITDHGFANYVLALTRRKLKKEQAEIDALQKSYPDMKIIKGIECDLLDEDGNIDLTEEDFKKLDLVILGFHRYIGSRRFFKTFAFAAMNGYILKYFKSSEARIKRNTKSYITALENNPIDILAHISHYTKVEYIRLAKVCAELGTLVEINMKHLDEMESMIDELLEQTDCLFIVDSDAHNAKRIAEFAAADEFIARHKIPAERIANLDKRPVFRRERELNGK